MIIKNIIAYILIFLGTVFSIKTGPLAKFLFYFNINNSIGIDLTNCHTFALSIIKTDFYYALFLFAFLISGFLLLFRKQTLKLKFDYFNISFLILFFILLGLSVILTGYIIFFIFDESLFDKHIIYNFIIGCFTNLLFLTLYSLIWFDQNLDNKINMFVNSLLFFCSRLYKNVFVY